MSEPSSEHTCLSFPGQWSSNFASTDFGPAPQLPAHQPAPLSDTLILSDADMNVYDWATIIRELGSDPAALNPLEHSADMSTLTANASPAVDAFEHSVEVSTSIYDASCGPIQPGDDDDVLAGAKFTMDGEVEQGLQDGLGGQSDSEPEEVHYGSVRVRTKVPKSELPRKRATYELNKGRKSVADADALQMKARWDQDIAIFNEKHGYLPNYNHPNLGLSETVKTIRGPCASNGLNSRAAAHFNAGEYP